MQFLHQITTFGLSIALSFLAGSLFLRKSFREKEALGVYNLPETRVRAAIPVRIRPSGNIGSIALPATVLGLIFGKLLYILENYGTRDIRPVLFSFSGINFYGALAGCAIAVWIYYRGKNIRPLYVIDPMAPGFMIAYAIGRLGCHVSGDGDWGLINTAPKPFAWLPDGLWACYYPHNLIGKGVIMRHCDWGNYCYQLPDPVYPTSLYEALICFLLFLLLWGLRNRITVPGSLMGLYLLLAGTERFLIERIRINPIIPGLNSTQAQLVSGALIVMGSILFMRIFFRNEKTSCY
nr:prolipoprotein diacylglyceryl transferase [Niabella beijingensis]